MKKNVVKKVKRSVEDQKVDKELFEAVQELPSTSREPKPTSKLPWDDSEALDQKQLVLNSFEGMNNDLLALAIQSESCAQGYRQLAKVKLRLKYLFKYLT